MRNPVNFGDGLACAKTRNWGGNQQQIDARQGIAGTTPALAIIIAFDC